MNSKQQDLKPEFIDLAASQNLTGKRSVVRGNIIKARQALTNGVERIEFDEAGPDQPKVLVHRVGEEVQRVEFRCTCGKTANLSFTYEDE